MNAPGELPVRTLRSDDNLLGGSPPDPGLEVACVNPTQFVQDEGESGPLFGYYLHGRRSQGCSTRSFRRPRRPRRGWATRRSTRASASEPKALTGYR